MAAAMNRFSGLNLLGPYLRPYRGRVALALLSLLVAAGTVLAFGACLRALIDRGFAQGRPDVLNYALASLLVVAVVLAIASGARFYLVSWLGERVVGDLRRDLFAHVVRLGPAWFEIKRSGDVMSRISADAQLIEQVIGSSASVALRNTLMCVGGVAMLVITNPKLALFVLAVVPFVVAPIILFGRKVRALSREAQARMADMVSEGGETLDAVRTVQAFAQEDRAARRFGEATERAFDAARRRVARRAVMTTLVIFIVFAAVGFLLWMGGHDVISGPHQRRRSLGLRVLRRAGGELGRRHQRDHRRPAARRGRGRAPGRARRRAGRSSSRPPIPRPCPSRCRAACASRRSRSAIRRGPTRWRSIASTSASRRARRWPSSARRARARPRSSTCCCASTIRKRARSASTASTSAICALPTCAVRSPSCRRSRCCSRPRSPTTSATAGPTRPTPRSAPPPRRPRRSASSRPCRRASPPISAPAACACRAASASASPSPARCCCDPAILLLDEATSALDAESELAVQQALDRLMHKRTTLVIAHRLATVQKADRIVVIDHGRVVDVGRHADLVRRDGLYARLAELQFNLSAAAS